MPEVWPVPPPCGTQQARLPFERELAGLAARQHGLVALRQLEALGLSASGVRARVAGGRLHRVHRGVYSVGHSLLAAEGLWLAAVLAGGPGAVLSHRSAAALWALRPSARRTVEITTPRRACRIRAGIEAHSGATLAPADAASVDGIPCTTVARTLLDLAAVVDRRTLERAFDQAEVLRVLDGRALDDLLGRTDLKRRGASALGAVLAEHHAGSTLTRSELEERFLALCSTAALPRPEVNAWVALPGGGVEVDFLWRAERLSAEADGRQVHGTRQAFERDRRRDQRLLVAGWRVVRFTWRQVTHEAGRAAATLRALLGASRTPEERGDRP